MPAAAEAAMAPAEEGKREEEGDRHRHGLKRHTWGTCLMEVRRLNMTILPLKGTLL